MKLKLLVAFLILLPLSLHAQTPVGNWCSPTNFCTYPFTITGNTAVALLSIPPQASTLNVRANGTAVTGTYTLQIETSPDNNTWTNCGSTVTVATGGTGTAICSLTSVGAAYMRVVPSGGTGTALAVVSAQSNIAYLNAGGLGGYFANFTTPTTGQSLCFSGGQIVNGSCGGGGGAGTVTSVALTTPAWLTVSGSPITTSGTLAITGTSETANYFLAAPNGSAGALTPRAIVSADIPTLNQNTTGTAGGLTGSPAITVSSVTDSGLTSGDCVQASTGGLLTTTGSACGSGSAGVSSLSGDGTIISNSASTGAVTLTLHTAAQNSVLAGPTTGGAGAPTYQTAPTISAANMTSFPTFNQNTSGTAGGLSGSPAITVSSVTDSGLTSGDCVQASTGGLLATTGAACGSGSAGVSSLSGDGTIISNSASTGAVTLTLHTAAQNSVLAGPTTGGAGAPTYQTAPTISAANMTAFPTFNQNTTGTAAGLSGSQTANYIYAAPNGSAGTATFRAMVSADVPTLNQNTTGTAGGLTGSPAITVSSVTDSGLTSGSCVQASTGGLLTTTGSACGSGGGSSALSAITAATGANTIASGNNGAQVWNWAQTTNSQTAFTIGETTAATGTSDLELAVKTLAGSTAVPLTVSDSLSGSQTIAALQVLPTWNTSGVVDAGILENVTNTASGAGSLLIDLQVGGTSEFKTDKAGNGTFGGAVTSTPSSGVAGIMSLSSNTTLPTLTAGEFSLIGANSASVTAFGWQVPTATNSSAGLVHVAADVSGVSQLSVSQVSLTADVTGVLPIANGGSGSATFAAHSFLGNTTGSTAAPSVTLIGAADSTPPLYVAGGGTAQAQTATLSPAVPALVAGLEVRWLPTAANTAAAPTLAVNGLAAKSITKLGTTALAANDLTTTAIANAIYDGTQWELQNPQTTSGGGSGTVSNCTTAGAVFYAAATGTTATCDTNIVDTANQVKIYTAAGNSGLYVEGGTAQAAPIFQVGLAGNTPFIINQYGGIVMAGPQINSPTAIDVTQTTVSCSTSGTAVFSEPFDGLADTKVMISLAACLGTASYTYPSAFTHTPGIFPSSTVAASLVTSLSTTATTVTGATSTGVILLENY